jgi:hypothetical protein
MNGVSIDVRSDTRQRWSDIVRLSGKKYELASFDSEHIFFTLLQHSVSSGTSANRLYLLHEFTQIDKLVREVKKGRLKEAERRICEIEALRSKANLAGQEARVLDCSLLPAVALFHVRSGEPDIAINKLESAVANLDSYFAFGVSSAGLASIEQSLNIVRAISGDSDHLADAVVDYFGKLSSGGVVSDRGDFSFYLSDASPDGAFEFFLDEAVLKTFSKFKGPKLTAIIARILHELPEGPMQSRISSYLELLEQLLLNHSGSAALERFSDADIEAMPLSIAMAAEILTSNGEAHDDGLARSVRDCALYQRFRSTVLEAIYCKPLEWSEHAG